MALFDRFRRRPAVKSTTEPIAFVLQPDGRVMSVKSYGGTFALQAYGSLSSLPLSSSAQGYAQAYLASVWAYRAIEVRVDAIARMPHAVVDKQTKKPISDHPLTLALERSRRIIANTERTRQIYGETFLWPRLNPYGYYYDIRWLNNLAMDVDTSLGYISGFNYYPINGGKAILFKREQIAYLYTDNPFDDLRGLSPLETVLQEIGIDREQARTMRSFYANDARPGLLLLPKRQIQPDQAQPLIDWWKDNFGGSNNAGKPAIMPFDIEDVKEFQRAPVEEDVMVSESIQKKIAAALDVPLPMLIGLSEATYDSANDIRKSFYEETVIPACDAIADEYTRELLPYFGDPGKEAFAFQYAGILALMENQVEKAEIANARLQAGGITLNEYRRDIGKPAIDGGDGLYMPLGVSLVPVDQLKQLPPPVAPEPEPTPPLLPAPAETKDEGVPVYMSLSLAGNADLLALQQRLKALYPDAGVEWSAADDYHITLVYVPSANAASIETVRALVKQIAPPRLELGLGSLHSFDSLDSHALHFRVRRNADLLALQDRLYSLCQSEGMSTSGYSIPERYIPHVTMGYAPNKLKTIVFDGKLSVQPDALLLYAGDDLLERIPVDVPQPTPYEELQAWEKNALNKGALKAKAFTVYAIRPGIAEELRTRLQGAVDKTAIKAEFAWARGELDEDGEITALWPIVYRVPSEPRSSVILADYDIIPVKAFTDTRRAFTDEMLRIIGAAQADDVSRQKFGGEMRRALRTYGLVAFRDGLNQAGSNPESLGDAELKSFRAWQVEQSGYVTSLGAEIFRAGITEAQVQQRAYMWADISLEAARLRGIEAGDAGAMMEWMLGAVQEEHCDACPRLAGTILPISVWRKANVLPGSGKTPCKQGCQCTLKLRQGAKAKGSIDWIKAEIHDHAVAH